MYRAHRESLLELLTDEDTAGVVFTGKAPIRNNDCEYRFRPGSDFWWLTGFVEPDCVLVLLPGRDGEDGRTVLFLRERVKAEEIWTGRRLGVEAAPAALGVDEAYPITELWRKLPDLLTGQDRVMYRSGEDEDRDRRMLQLAASLRRRVRNGVAAPLEWVDPTELLHELRLHKSEGELAAMRSAAAITAEAHTAAMAQTAPGVGEHEIDALIDYTFRRRGSTGQAYSNIVAGGANACVLHYVENDQPLEDGDLLLIDAGAEWEFYASDVTRTFPVNGTFTAEQRALYEVVLGAQKAAVEAIEPGVTFASIHDVAVEHVTRGLVDLGLVEGPVDKAIEDERYKPFYMHKTGHWLGLDVHDCGLYHVAGSSRVLEPGMVLTVEPGIYVDPDDDAIEARWRGIGIRIEDDIVVTADGHENLTASIPKEVDEVEAACRGAELQPA
jgi:Xaa-Pro aminopeptidase